MSGRCLSHRSSFTFGRMIPVHSLRLSCLNSPIEASLGAGMGADLRGM